jgi:cell division initiation protein
MHSQKVLDQMQENARRQADVIIAEAETKAERLLQQAQNRVVQLTDSIAGLKRQRIQIEEEITYVIETHRRMLEAGRESERESDEQVEKLKVLKTVK